MSTAIEHVSAPAVGTAARIVRRVRAAWLRGVTLRGLATALALPVVLALALLAIDLVLPLPAIARLILRWVPPGAALSALAWTAARVARPPSPHRLALLAEERVPGLENRLATALDLDAAAGGTVVRAFLADAERRLAVVDLRGVAPARAGRRLAAFGVSAALLAAFALAFPAAAAAAWERWARPADAYPGAWEERRAEVLSPSPASPVPGFDELRWTVEPPAYAGLRATSGRGDDEMAALPGSRIRLRSRFAPRWAEVRARRPGGAALAVERDGGEWVVAWTQAPGDRGVEVEAWAAGAVADRRVVPVATLPDRAPDVNLVAPAKDLVLPSGDGRVELRATASDDYGVAGLKLTYIRSRGSGESFEFVEGEWAFPSLRRDGRTAEGTYSLDLKPLDLQPGDMVHVRAVATDGNTVTGPGESVSRTRVIRVARAEEVDEINAVTGFPIELPKDPLLSQRMIVLMTERLRDRASRMTPREIEAEAISIAHEQGRLRERVGEQVFTRATGGMHDLDAEFNFEDTEGEAHGAEGHGAEEAKPETPEELLERASEATGTGSMAEVAHRHDADPILDVNQTLMAIYNLMWASERELNQSAYNPALPHQYEALRMIQQLQGKERRYVRGQVRIEPIDPAAARGQGKVDEAAPERRAAGRAVPDAAPLRAAVDAAAARVGSAPPREASLALSALASQALAAEGADPRVASLLSRAASAAAAGRRDRATELLRAARGLLGATGSSPAPAVPSTADPAAADYFRRLGRPGAP